MIADLERPIGSRDVIGAILPFVTSGNEVIRSLALRAIAILGANDPRLHATLLGALLDPDPDVRTDAMELLAVNATEADAPAILHSLEGDPVREVKLAAIRALVRLRYGGSIERLRALAVDRCDDEVAWEDDLGDWEDWLDIQVASIEALGEMEVTASIGDMLRALGDEYGQTLDILIFNAFIRLGPPGVAQLVEQLQSQRPLRRRRAVDALLKADAGALAPYIDTLLASPEPDLRRAVLVGLSPSDIRCAEVAKTDPSPAVRAFALMHAAHAHPGLAVFGLADASEAVKAAALNRIDDRDRASLGGDLEVNLIAWMRGGQAVLASTAARALADLVPRHAAPTLLDLAQNLDRPLEARVAAVEALSHATLPKDHNPYDMLMENPSQQVRAAALRALHGLATAGDETAVQLLAAAIDGTRQPAKLVGDTVADPYGPDLTTPKGEGSGPRRIHISPEGEIIETGEFDNADGAQEQSTLASIQLAQRHEPFTDMAEDTPEESAPKRKRRRSVEGPTEIADDLSLVAMAITADINEPAIREAFRKRLDATDNGLRKAAWAGLCDEEVLSEASPEILERARVALQDEVQPIRLAAFSLLAANNALHATEIDAALADEDGQLRATALRMIAPERAVSFLFDPNNSVRRAAAAALSEAGSNALRVQAVQSAIDRERSDALEALHKVDAMTLPLMAEALSQDDVGQRQAMIILKALNAR